MIIEALISAIGSLGFGIIFNIKGKKLIFASIGGGLSWLIYTFSLNLNNTDMSSLLFSSVICSIYAEIFARYLRTPVTTFIIVSIIPLVPGASMYYTMYEATTGDIYKAMELGLTTISNAGVIAIGVILVSTITRQIVKLKKNKS